VHRASWDILNGPEVWCWYVLNGTPQRPKYASLTYTLFSSSAAVP